MPNCSLYTESNVPQLFANISLCWSPWNVEISLGNFNNLRVIYCCIPLPPSLANPFHWVVHKRLLAQALRYSVLNLVFQFHPRSAYVPPALPCSSSELQQLAPICCCCWPQLAQNALKVRPECLANFHLFMPRSRPGEGGLAKSIFISKKGFGIEGIESGFGFGFDIETECEMRLGNIIECECECK